MKDLFTTNNPPQLPMDIIARVTNEGEDMNYQTLQAAVSECEAIGYTFDFYLDAEPFALRPIGTPLNEVEGYEDINL